MRNKFIVLGLLGGFMALLIFLVQDEAEEMSQGETAVEQDAILLGAETLAREDDSPLTRFDQEEKAPESAVAVSSRVNSLTQRPEEDGLTILTGRVLNLEGRVAKSKTLKARVQFHSASVDEIVQYTLRTDDNGRFRHVFRDEDVSPSSIKKFWVITGKSKNKLRRIAAVDFSTSLPEGVTDLGDLVVEAPPVLIEGTVVDQAGNPIPGAMLVLKRSRHSDDSLGPYDASRRDSRSRAMETDFGFWTEEGPWWEELGDLSIESDEDGWFQIRGEFNPWALHLEARHSDFVDSEIEVGIGERHAQLVLGRSSKIQGRFLFDKDLRGKPMTIWMELEGRPREGFGTGLRWDGGFSFSDIAPGVVHISLKANSSNEVLFEWRDLLVTSEETVVQLPDIDLRGQLHVMALKVTDTNGRSVRDAKIQLSGMDYPEEIRSNPISLVSKAHFFSMSVGAKGKRTQYLSEVSGKQTVELQEGFSVRIVVDNFSAVKKTTFVGVLFHREGMKHVDSPREQLRAAIDTSSGTVQHVFTQPGRFEVELYLIDVDPVSRNWTQISMDENANLPIIEILEVDHLQTFHVSLDLDTMQRSTQDQ